MEAKYHRESQMQDRKVLAEQLKQLKDSLSEEGPPSKVSNTGQFVNAFLRTI